MNSNVTLPTPKTDGNVRAHARQSTTRVSSLINPIVGRAGESGKSHSTDTWGSTVRFFRLLRALVDPEIPHQAAVQTGPRAEAGANDTRLYRGHVVHEHPEPAKLPGPKCVPSVPEPTQEPVVQAHQATVDR